MPPFDDRARSPFDRPPSMRGDSNLREINGLLERLLEAQKKIGAVLDVIDLQKDKHPLAGEHPTPETKAEIRAILQRLMELQNKIQELETQLTKAEQDATAEQKKTREEAVSSTDDPFAEPGLSGRRPPFRRRPERARDYGMFRDEPESPFHDELPDEPIAPMPRVKLATTVPESLPPIQSEPVAVPKAEAAAAVVLTPTPTLSPEETNQALQELAKYEADYKAYMAQWEPIFNDRKTGQAQKDAHPEVVKYIADMEAYLTEQRKRLGVTADTE